MKYHRTIGSMLATLRRYGLHLDTLDEPLPTAGQVRRHPHLAPHRRRPPLLLIRAHKA